MSMKRIKGYVINMKQLLGKGAYGSVYKGQQQNTKLPVAIKILVKNQIDKDQYLKAALFSEIKILKTLTNDNIVRCYDVMQSSQNYYIVQQLCNGDLQGLLKKEGGKLKQQPAIQILKQICNGFLALIRQGIIHRDLKPANIMLINDKVKIGDFGFAKKNANKKAQNQTAVGTPLYMSIQILKGKPYTSKCDIWALGMMFYQLLHGITPWIAHSQFELIKNIENKPLQIKAKVSPNTKDFLEKCLKPLQQNRISWDQLFVHPIFQGIFDKFVQQNKQFDNKFKTIMGDLRFKINSQNIDLKNYFASLGFKQNQELKFDDFQKLLQNLNPEITSQQSVFIFQKIDVNNNAKISLKELEGQMQKNHIMLTSKQIIPNFEARMFGDKKEQTFDKKQQENSLSAEMEKKVRTCFKKLHKTIESKFLSLYKTFLAYDTDKNKKLSLQEFSRILKRLDASIQKQQIELVFDFIDIDKNKFIEFTELNAYYSKVNGIPQSVELKQFQKCDKK